jgi:hypothetical protein
MQRLAILTDYVIEEYKHDANGKMMSKLGETLGHASSVLPGNAVVWQSYAEYHNARGNTDKVRTIAAGS